MQRLRSATLAALLTACASAPAAAPRKSAAPAEGGPSCYRISGPFLSPTAAASVQWLVLDEPDGEGESTRWFGGRAVVRGSAAQQVQWQSSRPGIIRVRWGTRGSSMELRDNAGNITGNAESGAVRWRVRGVREECTGVGA